MRFLLALMLAAAGCGAAAEEETRTTLALGGDTMLARLVTETVLEKGPRYVWGDVMPLLKGAGAALVNLECCIAAGGEPFEPRRVFYFRAHPQTVECLQLAGIDGVSLANNHALDYGPAALVETLERLDRAGIAHAGAGQDLAGAARPAFVEAGGVRIGMVSFADHFREYAAAAGRAGTNVIRIKTSGEDFERVRRALRACRDGGADVVVFSIHWGPNMREIPPAHFRRFARAVMDAGADVFFGHSAHVFQGIEIHRGKPILYDTGDLVDDYRVDRKLRNDRQLLYLLEIEGGRVRGLELVPLFISRRQVNRARGEDFDAIERRLKRLSAEFGTRIVRRGERLRVEMPAGQ